MTIVAILELTFAVVMSIIAGLGIYALWGLVYIRSVWRYNYSPDKNLNKALDNQREIESAMHESAVETAYRVYLQSDDAKRAITLEDTLQRLDDNHQRRMFEISEMERIAKKKKREANGHG